MASVCLRAALAAFITTLLISIVTAIQIPTDLPDGVLLYTPPQVPTSDHDPQQVNAGWQVLQEYHTTETPNSDLSKRSAKLPRYTPLPIADGDFQCYTPSKLDANDTSTAALRLSLVCDSPHFKIPPSSSVISKNGGTAVFACNYGQFNPCGGDEITEALRRLNDEFCHDSHVAGWVLMKDWAKKYGRDLADADICPDLIVSGNGGGKW